MPRSCSASSIPAYFAGGSLKLDPSSAREAIERRDRAAARPVGRGGGARHPSRGQRADGRGHPAASRSAAASIRAGSRWCRSAAAGRCMRPRSPPSSASAASSCRAIPACCRPRACWPRRSSTRCRPPSRGRSPGSTSPRCARVLGRAGRRMRALMAEESIGGTPVSIQLLRRCLLHRPVLSSGGAARRRCAPTRSAALYRDFLRAARSHLRPRAPSSRPRIVNLRTVHRAGGSDRLDDGAYRPTGADPRKGRARSCVAGARAPVAGGDLRSRRDAGRAEPSPARPSSSRTTRPRWSSRAGAARSTRHGNLLLERGN